MASSAMILGLATARSLVLVDELGRGTSPTEGVGISHAIAESMIETGVSFGRSHKITLAHILAVLRILCYVRLLSPVCEQSAQG